VIVDWESEAAAVVSSQQAADLDKALEKKTVTSGCGQGTMYGSVMKKLEGVVLAAPELKQSTLYALLKALSAHNETYKMAGAVHGCAICRGSEILSFVEDVGRHNAVDTLAGELWMSGEAGHDKIFYTTGRLTSEMVIKVAQMGIPVLLSRSGVTQMGLDLARQLGITMIARAKGRHFEVFSGHDHIVLDEKPPVLAAASAGPARGSSASHE
jgi:FdhD protein